MPEPFKLTRIPSLKTVEDFRKHSAALGIELPCAECNGRAHFIADWEDHPVAEAVDWALAPVAYKARGSKDIQFRNGVAATRAVIGAATSLVVRAQAFQVAHERVPSIRRGTDIESFAHRFRDIVCIKCGARACTDFGVSQSLAIEIRSDRVCAE